MRWGRLSEFGSPQTRIQFWKGFRLLDQCVSHLSFRQLSWTRSLQEAPAFMIIGLNPQGREDQFQSSSLLSVDYGGACCVSQKGLVHKRSSAKVWSSQETSGSYAHVLSFE